ncbi:hypothetical protein E2C01_054961 [Portunus trituberculatus]|uniref:Uncharacterized protein n=1 Tax=Portunus trituberculatus TaxID=210409 RepID=A0A5B7GL68_PORTR|nr:hypothetical protein [Portunus trituberculatus]
MLYLPPGDTRHVHGGEPRPMPHSGGTKLDIHGMKSTTSPPQFLLRHAASNRQPGRVCLASQDKCPRVGRMASTWDEPNLEVS